MYQLAKGVTTHSHVRRKKLKRKEGGTVIISKRRYFTRFCFSLSISHSFDVDCPPHLAVTQTSRNEAIERGAVRGSNANSRRRPQRVNKLQFSFSLSFLFVSFFFLWFGRVKINCRQHQKWTEGERGTRVHLHTPLLFLLSFVLLLLRLLLLMLLLFGTYWLSSQLRQVKMFHLTSLSLSLSLSELIPH